MESRIAKAMGIETHPVALIWSHEKPEGAAEFKPGRWGCVMSLFAEMEERVPGSFLERETWRSLGH